MMDVIYRLDHPSPPQFTSPSVSFPIPVESSPDPRLSFCRSCPVSLAVWRPCLTALQLLKTALYHRRLGALPSQACSRFSHGCATERITHLCKPHPCRLVLFPSPGFRPKSRCGLTGEEKLDIQDTGDCFAFDSSLGRKECKNNHLFFYGTWPYMDCFYHMVYSCSYSLPTHPKPTPSTDCRRLNSVSRPP